MTLDGLSLEELDGDAIKESHSVSELLGRWSWDERGELWQLRDYARKEYWGERVFELRNQDGWVKSAPESQLRALSWGVGRQVCRLPKEHISELGKMLMERRALRDLSAQERLLEGAAATPRL